MNGNSSKLTNKKLSDLLDGVKKNLVKQPMSLDVDLDKIWQLVVGEKISGMTKVLSFNEGLLIVQVQSSTLNNLLSRTERPKILMKLKKDFPYLKVKNLLFRSG